MPLILNETRFKLYKKNNRQNNIARRLQNSSDNRRANLWIFQELLRISTKSQNCYSKHFRASSQNMSVCPIKSIKSCNNRRFDFSLWCRWLNELALRRHMIKWMANEKWQRFVRNMKDIGNYNTINKTSIFCDSHFRIRRKWSELTIHICMHINSTRHSNK